IVRDVSVGHDQRVTAHARHPAALDGAPVDGDKLANLVVVADLEPGGFAGVSDVLRRHADRTEGKEAVVRADFRRSLDGDVRNQMAAFAHFDFRANHAIGADLAGGMNLRARIDDGCGMNQCGSFWRGVRLSWNVWLRAFGHTGAYSGSSVSAAPSDPPRPRAASTSWQLTTASATRLAPT